MRSWKPLITVLIYIIYLMSSFYYTLMPHNAYAFLDRTIELSVESYVPFKQGEQRCFRVERIKGNYKEIEEHQHIVLAKTILGDREVIPMKVIHKTKKTKAVTTTYWYINQDKCEFIGEKDGNSNLKLFNLVTLIAPIRKNTSWRSGLFNKIIILSTNETITVPAGTYNNCLKIIYLSDDTNPNKTPRWTRWYASGVGSIKTVMETSLETDIIELISFKK
jgi:hypothetical protein